MENPFVTFLFNCIYAHEVQSVGFSEDFSPSDIAGSWYLLLIPGGFSIQKTKKSGLVVELRGSGRGLVNPGKCAGGACGDEGW